MASYPRISEETYQKAKSQLRLALGDVMHPLRLYGQDVYVDGAIDEAVELAENFAMVCRGKQIPIIVKNKRNPRT